MASMYLEGAVRVNMLVFLVQPQNVRAHIPLEPHIALASTRYLPIALLSTPQCLSAVKVLTPVVPQPARAPTR